MSEFKAGDHVIYMHPAYTLVYLVQAVKGMEILVNEVWFDGYHFRHATPEEIAAGHRIDNDLGDDFPIENRISPLCKSKDV
ncbi:hypothetical protein [Acinetobacter baumannii]|uniref:hypothetical protein n=1 Tax=Acinetobacter baumannii TaxID=470 RepID=UPI000BF25AD3|nr:hypothetical protein [Acinetobacter baumannii]